MNFIIYAPVHLQLDPNDNLPFLQWKSIRFVIFLFMSEKSLKVIWMVRSKRDWQHLLICPTHKLSDYKVFIVSIYYRPQYHQWSNWLHASIRLIPQFLWLSHPTLMRTFHLIKLLNFNIKIPMQSLIFLPPICVT